MSEICRKDSLARNMNRMLKLFPKDYNIFPRTWCLPAESVCTFHSVLFPPKIDLPHFWKLQNKNKKDKKPSSAQIQQNKQKQKQEFCFFNYYSGSKSSTYFKKDH